MQSPLPQFTTLLLLIHLGFGCCFHHAHACEADCCPTPIAAAEACPCGTHEHDEDPAGFVNAFGNCAGSGHHGEQHECAGEYCTFVVDQPLPEQAGEFAAGPVTLEVNSANAEARSCRTYLDRNLDWLLPIAGSSLRTHLALRVLLI